jgi:hypothetical protein
MTKYEVLYGYDRDKFEGIMAGLVRADVLRKQGDLYFVKGEG